MLCRYWAFKAAHRKLRKLALRSAEFDPQLYYCGGPSLIRAAERLAQIRDEAA